MRAESIHPTNGLILSPLSNRNHDRKGDPGLSLFSGAVEASPAVLQRYNTTIADTMRRLDDSGYSQLRTNNTNIDINTSKQQTQRQPIQQNKYVNLNRRRRHISLLFASITCILSFVNLSFSAIAAARSPIIMAIACVGVCGMCGVTDVSATRRPETPCTLTNEVKAEKEKHRSTQTQTNAH